MFLVVVGNRYIRDTEVDFIVIVVKEESSN